MAHTPIEQLLPQANNSIYKLVKLAAARAIELAEGRKKLIEHPSSEKLATVALEEIRDKTVVLREAVDVSIPKPKGKEIKEERVEAKDEKQEEPAPAS